MDGSALTFLVFVASALAVTLALAMLLLVLWQAPRDRDNQLMAGYFAVVALWGASIFTARLVAFTGGDPRPYFYGTFLAAAANGFVLFALVSHYARLWTHRMVRLGLIGGLVALAVIVPLLYREQLVVFVAYTSDGLMDYRVTALGNISFAVFVAFYVATLVCLWASRGTRAQRLLSGSAVVIGAALVGGLMPATRHYPLPTMAAALSAVLFARAILREKLFHPLAQLNRELADANVRLRQGILDRERLIADLDFFDRTVAHDLKDPLSTVLAAAGLLSESCDDMSREERQQFLDALVRGGRKMAEIIDALLLLAGVRQREIDLTTLDMGAIVAAVRQRLSHFVDEHRAEISVPRQWPAAVGYGPWVEEVWSNYLSNAVKYGGQPPRVELGATTRSDGKREFWVRDDGRGLSAEQLAQVFLPFTRLQRDSVDGHGLGLTIAQRIVQRLGGEVSVTSSGVPGEGCTFRFTLPAAPDVTTTAIAD